MIRSIAYIEKMVCHDRGVMPNSLHTRSRKDPHKTIRQVIMTLAIEQGHTMAIAGAYFDRDHATALSAKRCIYNRVETEKAFREKFERYRGLLKTKESFRADYLGQELSRLRQEVGVLQNQLNMIAI